METKATECKVLAMASFGEDGKIIEVCDKFNVSKDAECLTVNGIIFYKIQLDKKLDRYDDSIRGSLSAFSKDRNIKPMIHVGDALFYTGELKVNGVVLDSCEDSIKVCFPDYDDDLLKSTYDFKESKKGVFTIIIYSFDE